jgi:hypothetical protein
MSLYPDYATVAELRSYSSTSGTAEDARLQFALTSASRAIDQATNRQFGVLTVAAARYYTPCWSPSTGRWVAEVDDLSAIAGLVVKSDLDDNAVYETTITTYRLWPLNAASDGRPWDQIVFDPGTSVATRPGSLEVTALWGWLTVPVTVKNATLLQASRFVKRKDAPFGVAGSPEMGSELRLLAKCDPDVEVMLLPYAGPPKVA